MIKTHEFNSRWWGKPVGLVTDNGFFTVSSAEQKALVQPFEWVEFRMPLDSSPVDLRTIHQAGFFQVDTQINYRLGLKKLKSPGSLADLTVEFADEMPFTIALEDVKSFDHERFVRLPGMSPDKANQRYILWSEEHLSQHPATSLRVLFNGQVQGWYLAKETKGTGLNLTLGMLSGNASVSGLLVFLKSYHAFASRGHRIGWASFSVNNTPVHNIYAAVGAHFLSPEGHWVWTRG